MGCGLVEREKDGVDRGINDDLLVLHDVSV